MQLSFLSTVSQYSRTWYLRIKQPMRLISLEYFLIMSLSYTATIRFHIKVVRLDLTIAISQHRTSSLYRISSPNWRSNWTHELNRRTVRSHYIIATINRTMGWIWCLSPNSLSTILIKLRSNVLSSLLTIGIILQSLSAFTGLRLSLLRPSPWQNRLKCLHDNLLDNLKHAQDLQACYYNQSHIKTPDLLK